MKAVTVVTDVENMWLRRVLAPSCAHHGLELVVLRSKRPLSCQEGGTYREKDRCLAQYLTNVPDDELILFTDGYDAIMLSGSEEIEAKFHDQGHPVLMAAECNLWPNVRWVVDNYPDAPGPAKYVNTGGFIGRAADLRRILERVEALPPDKHVPWSNQIRWITLFIQETRPFALDHGSELFFAAAPTAEPDDYAPWGSLIAARGQPGFWKRMCEKAFRRFTVQDGRVRLPHGARPCHLHFNGVCAYPLYRDLRRLAPLMPWL